MSDLRELPELPDLVADVRERVVVPPYDEVQRRVRARRRRGAVGAMAAAVLVVGGLGVWQELTTTSRPATSAPADQGPLPPVDGSLWRSVVDGTGAHPFQYAGNDDGSV